MRRFVFHLWAVTPGLLLILCGVGLQRFVIFATEANIKSGNFSAAFNFSGLAQFALILLLTALLVAAMFRPLLQSWAIGYIVVSLIVLLFRLVFMSLGSIKTFLPIPLSAANYLLFLTRPVEFLSWILVFSVGLFNLVVTLLNKQKKI
jgi:hypothetical protein